MKLRVSRSPLFRSARLKMNKVTLLRCKVDDQIGLFDSAESKLLNLLTQGGQPTEK